MTGDTGVGDAGMIKHRHQPVVSGMTNFADLGGRHVRCAFADGNNAIVTRLAGPRDLRMIHQRTHWYPGCVDMTGLAQIGSRDVSRALADGQSAVVASNTGFRHCRMTECGYEPVRAGMTGIASGDSRNMGYTLAGGDHTVMARLAGSQYFSMIHQRIHRCPGRKHVTGLTKIRGVDMRGALTRRGCAIVTGNAGVGNTAVIKRGD